MKSANQIHVKDIIINQKREKRDENYKTYIERVLTHIEEQKSAYQFDIRIFKKANVDVKEDVADKLWDIIRLDKISEFDIARFKGCADDVILSYKINSNIIHVSVRDFMDYFNNLALIRRLSTKSIFYYYLREVAWEAHALQHVDRLGICHEKDFVINKQLYRNSLIVDALIEDKIGEITEDEIKERYNRDNQRFNLGEYAIVSLLHFSSRQHALRGWRFCDEHMLTRLDSTTLKQADLPGLVSTEFGMKLHYRSEIFEPKILEQVFDQENNTIGRPVKINQSKYVIIYKEGKTGTRLKPYSTVRKLIRKELFLEKYQAIKTKLYTILKDTYRIDSRLNSLEFKR